MKKLIFIFMACLVTYGLQAQTYIWTGGTGNWSDGSHWSTGSVPSSTNNVQISSGNPTLDGNFSVQNITVSSGAGINFTTNTLTVYGIVGIGGTGTLSGSSGNLLIANSGNSTSINIANVYPTVSITCSGGIAMGTNTGGTHFYNDVTITQTGGSGTSAGCTYDGDLNIALNSGNMTFCGGSSVDEFYNGDINVSNSGGGTLTFGGNGTRTSRFGQSSGTSGSFNIIGPFASGVLRLNNFHQYDASDASPQTISLSGAAQFFVDYNSVFEGNLTAIAALINFKNSRFKEETNVTQTAAGAMYGGNTFDKQLDIHYTGTSGTMVMYQSGIDTYNGSINIYGSGGDINFGQNTGSSGTLNAPADFNIISFASGTIQLRSFTQYNSNPSSPNPQTISLTGSARFRTTVGTIFYDDVDIDAPLTIISNTHFMGKANINNMGSSTTASVWEANNIYDNEAKITNSGSGTLTLANVLSGTDTYYGDVTFKKSGSGLINIADWSSKVLFYGDVIFDGINNSQIINSQRGKFEGGAQQHIKAQGGATVTFGYLEFNKTAGDVTLDTRVNIGNSCTFTTSGTAYRRIISTNSNILYFASGSTVSNASDYYYVEGPVIKQGNTSFTFPVGKAGYYRPIIIDNYTSGTGATEFKAEYMMGNATVTPYGPNKDATIDDISTCEYWKLERAVTLGAKVDVYLTWNPATSCNIATDANMRVAGWNSSSSIWNDHGNGGNGTIGSQGYVKSASTQPTNYNAFTLANTVCTTSASITPDGDLVFCTAVDPDGVVLTATSASYYQWSLDGVEMPAETTQTVTATVTGEYSVEIHDADGCIGTASVDVIAMTDCCVPLGPCGTVIPGTDHSTAFGTIISGSLPYDGLIRNETGPVDCGACYFVINSDFYIDNNFTFQNTCVVIKPGVHIYVTAGYTLTLDNAHMYGCDAMWGGIVLADASSHLNVINNTLIEDAEFAINVSGGTYAIDHGNFNKNFISIFSTDNTNTAGDIRASRFLCYQTGSLNSTWVDSDLKSPYVGEHSFIGIVSIGSGGTPTITVGGLATSQGCKFANLYNGIFGFQSNVISQYNTFENLVAPAWAFPGGTQPAWALPYMLTPPFLPMANGIFIDTEISTPISLNIPYQNRFNNCYTGVNVGRNTNSYVANCKFNDNVMGVALRLPTFTGRTTDIHANEFKRNAVAIYSKDLNGSTVDIYSNDINGYGAPVNTITPTTLGWGIYNTQQSEAGSNTLINIHANTISDVQYGIKVENWNNDANRIESNIITVDESSSLAGVDEGAGIWGAALYGPTLIAENSITGPHDHNGDLSGISLSSSLAILQCNTVQDLDNGILTKSGTGGVLVYKNTITNNTNGIFANSDGPSAIGASTSAGDNEWTSNTCDVYSNFNASAYTVYTQSSILPYAANICSNSSPTNDYGYDDTAPISPLYSCGVVKSLSDEDSLLVSQLRQLSNRIAMGEISSMDNKEEQFWNIQYGAYTRLVGNANAYNFANDILVNNYTAAHNGNIGKLYSAITYLGSNNNDSLTAQQHYNTVDNIVALNKSEQTLKSYVLLQLNRVAHPRFIVSAFAPIAQTAFQTVNPGLVYSPLYSTDLKYTPAEEQTLDSLATLCPSSHGVGVYMARAALSFKQVMFTSSCELSTTTATVENLVSGIAIYPNPSTGNVFVKLPTGLSNTKIQLFSSAGAILQSATVTGQLVELNMDVYANGLYIIRILDNNGNLLDTKKVSLVK